MVNVTNIFINTIKKIFKEKDLSLSDYVFCIVCGDLVKDEARLDFLIVPLSSFESVESELSLPFKKFIIYKKNGCWLSCDNGAFFHLINKKLSFNKQGEFILQKTTDDSKNSLSSFTGKCLMEHMKNEKLTRKELALNLNLTVSKLNLIFKGKSSSIGLSELLSMSKEFQGKNKISGQHFVMIEKITNVNKKIQEYEYEF
jgi:predicted transcriptional regulator